MSVKYRVCSFLQFNTRVCSFHFQLYCHESQSDGIHFFLQSHYPGLCFLWWHLIPECADPSMNVILLANLAVRTNLMKTRNNSGNTVELKFLLPELGSFGEENFLSRN